MLVVPPHFAAQSPVQPCRVRPPGSLARLIYPSSVTGTPGATSVVSAVCNSPNSSTFPERGFSEGKFRVVSPVEYQLLCILSPGIGTCQDGGNHVADQALRVDAHVGKT